MRKFYQTEWQDIRFGGFYPLSSVTLAGQEFYDAFYCQVFDRYSNYDSLPPSWRGSKDLIIDWLAASIPYKAKVLSVGCGLGYIEQRLWRLHSDCMDLYVQDFSACALKWIKQILPADHINANVCCASLERSKIERFNLVYLSAVDYAMIDDELISFLTDLKTNIVDGGSLLMISASFSEESIGQKIMNGIKDLVKWLLEISGIRHRGQFWGWMRSRAEYRSVMQLAGFTMVSDGFIEMPEGRPTYFIKGIK